MKVIYVVAIKNVDRPGEFPVWNISNAYTSEKKAKGYKDMVNKYRPKAVVEVHRVILSDTE